MGLRLYQAPVASDVASKPAADKSAAQARSSIRRTRMHPAEQRLHRRHRIYDGIASGPSVRVVFSDDLANGTGSPSVAENNRASDGLGNNTATSSHLFAPQARLEESTSGSAEPRPQAPRAMPTRMANDPALAILHRRYPELRDWGVLHGVGDRHDNRGRDSQPSRGARFWTAAPEPFALSNERSTQNASAAQTRYRSSFQHAARHMSAIRSALHRGESELDVRRRLNREDDPPLPSPRRQHDARDSSMPNFRTWSSAADSERGLFMDGLGDRNRSLSPEGDNLWDTLLASLEPDPHPSSGSSFASATASASAATAAGTGASSRTSFGGPDMADLTDDSASRSAPARVMDDLRDPPCDNDDSEDDDDNNRRRRFYTRILANATNSAPEWGDEIAAGLTGMHRIVRHLAHRHEIPDEWWAEAGLSRNLTRDNAPGN